MTEIGLEALGLLPLYSVIGLDWLNIRFAIDVTISSIVFLYIYANEHINS